MGRRTEPRVAKWATIALLYTACNDVADRIPASSKPVMSKTKQEMIAKGSVDSVPKSFEQVEERETMVSRQLVARGIRDKDVLDAMRKVPRHLFIPKDLRRHAYDDRPLPIGRGQTISQPYVVAFMSEALKLKPQDRVLEIGTGSGYQAAILGELVREVFTIEIVPELGERSKKLLSRLGYGNVNVRIGDGYKGWPEKAHFDAVIVTAAPPKVPQPLLSQLKIGGRMIIPVGNTRQELVVIHRTENGYERKNVLPVAFVPMTGEAQR